MNLQFTPAQGPNRLQKAINKLVAKGHIVERASDLPGALPSLYYVNNGPELTEAQLVHFAEAMP